MTVNAPLYKTYPPLQLFPVLQCGNTGARAPFLQDMMADKGVVKTAMDSPVKADTARTYTAITAAAAAPAGAAGYQITSVHFTLAPHAPPITPLGISISQWNGFKDASENWSYSVIGWDALEPPAPDKRAVVWVKNINKLHNI